MATEENCITRFPIPITLIERSLRGRQGFASAPPPPEPPAPTPEEKRAQTAPGNLIAGPGPHPTFGKELPAADTGAGASSEKKEA